MRDMATQPLDTAKVYALTAAGACSVTLVHGGKSITWEALTEGGQTSFLVPAGATVEISDTTALLSPLPANFNPALGTGSTSAGGACVTDIELRGKAAVVPMRNAAWFILPQETEQCTVTPYGAKKRACSLQLVITPDADLRAGWLSSPTAVVWLYGEPVILSGHTYIVGLTQIAPDKILANLLATF